MDRYLKMNILIIGKDYFSLATDPAHSVRVLSQPDALRAPTLTLSSLVQSHCPTFSPDIIFYTDESKFPTLPGLEELEIPLFSYFIDSHIHYGWHREFAGIFDHVFVAQKDCCDSFNNHTGNCSWLPLFATPDPAGNDDLIHDVSFVGTLDKSLNPERVRFIDSLGKMVPLTVHYGEFSKIFRQSKIILNQSVKNDINFRVFEALASGNLLLTDNIENGMDLLLKEGKHFISYRKNDPEDAADRIRYYLEHEEERKAIARAGYEALRMSHSTEVRRRQLTDAICSFISNWRGQNPQKTCNARTQAAARTYLKVARLVADLQTECGIVIERGEGYAMLADQCLQRAEECDNIEYLSRDLAWTNVYRQRHSLAKTTIHAALRMGAADFDTLMCAAHLASDQAETAGYIQTALNRLQKHRETDPLYYQASLDQLLLQAKRAGFLSGQAA